VYSNPFTLNPCPVVTMNNSRNFFEKLDFFYKTLLHLLAMNIMYGRFNVAFYRMRGTKIGKNTRITHGVFLEEFYPELITIEDNVHIGPNTLIVTHDSSANCMDPGFPVICKEVHIKRNVYIGTGAIILPGVTLGEFSIVASGAVVTKDVPSRTIVAGIPAAVIGSVDERLKKLADGDNGTRHNGS